MAYPYEVLPNNKATADKFCWGHMLEHCVGGLVSPWVIHDTYLGKFVFSETRPLDVEFYWAKIENMPYEGLTRILHTGLIENDQFATIPCPRDMLRIVAQKIDAMLESTDKRLLADPVNARTGLPKAGTPAWVAL